MDRPQVTLSSLNRHAVATRADVGTPKALCLQRHLEEIFPEATIEAVPGKSIDRSIDQSINQSINQWMDGCTVL